MYVEFIGFLYKNRDKSKGNHDSKNNIESHIETVLTWHEGVNSRGSFGKQEPVSRGYEEEIEHPKGPDINEVQKEQKPSPAVQVSDVGLACCMDDDKNVDYDEYRQNDRPKSR